MGTDRIDDLLEATQGRHSPLQKLLRNSENQQKLPSSAERAERIG